MHTTIDNNETTLSPAPDRLVHSNGIRIGRQLIKATVPFAVEDVAKS